MATRLTAKKSGDEKPAIKRAPARKAVHSKKAAANGPYGVRRTAGTGPARSARLAPTRSPTRPRERPARHRWSRSSMRKRSRADGEKCTEGDQNPTRVMPRRKDPDGSEYGTGSEVSGPVVSVPRGRSPTRSSESRHPFQPPSRPSSRLEVHQLGPQAKFVCFFSAAIEPHNDGDAEAATDWLAVERAIVLLTDDSPAARH